MDLNSSQLQAGSIYMNNSYLKMIFIKFEDARGG